LFSVFTADVVEWCSSYKGEPMHAALLDPPYHLTHETATKGNLSWNSRYKQVQEAKNGGFMGKKWDGGNIAFRPETWEAIASVLHPGAFIMAFSSCRTLHRMMVAMEDSGLVLHPVVMCWANGAGFPKATRIRDGKQEDTGETETLSDIRSGSMHAGRDTSKTYTRPVMQDKSPFAGHRYGLQALKPAIEIMIIASKPFADCSTDSSPKSHLLPIVVAQKPYGGRPVDVITQTGAGAFWIDGARIGTDVIKTHGKRDGTGTSLEWSKYTSPCDWNGNEHKGRWPANFLLCCLPTCTPDAHDPDCPAARLDRQSGQTSTTGFRSERSRNAIVENTQWLTNNHRSTEYPGDTGGASRFFFRAVADAIDEAEPVRYCAKASRRERNAGCDGLPEKTRQQDGSPENWDLSEAKVRSRMTTKPQGNHHPTVKPISLVKYCASLLLPPAAYAPRRILVPFAGSMSEAIGAMLAGWEEIVAIELDPEYVAIGKARLAWWEAKMKETRSTQPDAILKTCSKPTRPAPKRPTQPSLFAD